MALVQQKREAEKTTQMRKIIEQIKIEILAGSQLTLDWYPCAA